MEGVDAIVDVPNSAIALAVQEIAKEKNRVLLVSTAATADLTGKACSPVGVHWTWDTYAVAASAAKAIVSQGGDSWFFLTADFAFGHAMQRDTTRFVESSGGKVIGSVRHPLGTTDFASFLLQAQSSRAKIVGLANAGSDTTNSIKQAVEFGVARGGQRLAAIAAVITDVHAAGLADAQGLLLTTSFYWDRSEESQQWSKRFFARRGVMPTQMQAGVYSAVTHYLKAVNALGSDEAKAVVAKMRDMPIHDFFRGPRPPPRRRSDGARHVPGRGQEARGVALSLGLLQDPQDHSGRGGVPADERRWLPASRETLDATDSAALMSPFGPFCHFAAMQ